MPSINNFTWNGTNTVVHVSTSSPANPSCLFVGKSITPHQTTCCDSVQRSDAANTPGIWRAFKNVLHAGSWTRVQPVVFTLNKQGRDIFPFATVYWHMSTPHSWKRFGATCRRYLANLAPGKSDCRSFWAPFIEAALDEIQFDWRDEDNRKRLSPHSRAISYFSKCSFYV